jgi:hypothetical protein
MTTNSQRRISIERMAQIWRAIQSPTEWVGSGDWADNQPVTFGDLLDFNFEAETFEQFLDINAPRVQLYEEAV